MQVMLYVDARSMYYITQQTPASDETIRIGLCTIQEMQADVEVSTSICYLCDMHIDDVMT